jgi:hypothetical protein
LEINLNFQSEKTTKLDVLWALSNIAAGADTHIQAIIQNS